MTSVPLGIPDLNTAASGHLCLFHETDAVLRATVRDFMRVAIDDPRQGAALFGAPEVVHQTLASLELDLGRALDDDVRRGRLIVIESDPDPDICLELLRSAYSALQQRGYEKVRSVSRATWGLAGFPLPEDQLWLDSQLNEVLAGRPALLICTYDLGALPTSALVYGGLETHTHTIVSGQVAPSPAFVEPPRYFVDRLLHLPWLTPT